MSNFAKRRIWKYLLILNPEEKSRFSAWLKLELQDRQASVQRLWQNLQCLNEADILSESKAKFEIESRLWAKILPNEAFDESRFRKLSEQLIRHAEEFLAIESFRKDRGAKDLHLLRELGLRNSYQLYQTIYRKVKSRLNKMTIRDEQFFKDHALLDKEYQKVMIKIDSQDKFNFSSFFQSFDKWVLLEQARMQIFRFKNPTETLNSFIPSSQFFELLKNHSEYSQEPLLKIYTLLFELLNDTSDDFPTYFKLLQSYEQIINRDTIQFLYGNAANYLTIKANQTRKNIYYERLADLTQWGLQKKLPFMNGVLPKSSYKNVITLSLILAKKMEGKKKIDRIHQAKHYLENLKQYLPKEDQDDTYRFNKAIYYFTIGEFDKVEASLGGRAYSNTGFAVQGRIYGLMARFELEEYTYLLTAIRSLKRYIQVHSKTDLTSNTYKFYLQHLRFFNRLVKAYTVEDYVKLKKAIDKAPRVFEERWLLQKIEERMPNSKLLNAR